MSWTCPAVAAALVLVACGGTPSPAPASLDAAPGPAFGVFLEAFQDAAIWSQTADLAAFLADGAVIDGTPARLGTADERRAFREDSTHAAMLDDWARAEVGFYLTTRDDLEPLGEGRYRMGLLRLRRDGSVVAAYAFTVAEVRGWIKIVEVARVE